MLSKYVRYVIKHYMFAVLAFLFTLLYWMSAVRLPDASLVFPRALTYVLVPLFLWNGIESVRGFRRTLASGEAEGEKWNCSLNLNAPKVVVTLITLAYIIVMPIVGLMVTTAAYIVSLAYYLGLRKPVPLVLFTVLFTVAVYGVFVMWLRIRIPHGLLI